MVSPDNDFRELKNINFHMIYDYKNEIILDVIDNNCSKYEYRPQDQTNDTGSTRPFRREPRVPVRDADGGVLLLFQAMHQRPS